MNKDHHLIWLNKTESLTYDEKLERLAKGDTPETIYTNMKNLAEEVLLNACKDILSRHNKRGIGMLTVDHPNFRKGMPIVTYYLGTPHIGRQVAIVGARDCSAQGFYYTPQVVNHYLERGYAINSGLAYGVDINAHRETLNQEGVTQAFVAHGLDQCYPKRHQWHFNEIAKKGCVYSQYEMGIKAQKYRFIERNQLMVAMSDEVFVVESSSKSGALGTGLTALQLGRKTLTIEGPSDSSRCAGNHKLLKAGAERFEANHCEWNGPLSSVIKKLRNHPMSLEQLQKYAKCDIDTLDFYLFEIECHYWVSFKADGKWYYNGW